MSTSALGLLDSFDRLPESERREFALEILRRTRDLDLPPLDDEALALAADELFQELDAREASDARP